MKRYFLAAASSVALAMLVALSTSGCGRLRADLGMRPCAVVLLQKGGQGSWLVTVDLETFSVARRVRLRSLCLSIDGDPTTRLIATAQCGGPGADADSACGIYDAARGGLVHYVDLGAANPSDVAVGGGKAFLVHGLQLAEGLRSTKVDLAGGAVCGEGIAPELSGRPERSGHRVMLPVAGAGMLDAQVQVLGAGAPEVLAKGLGYERLVVVASDVARSPTVVVGKVSGTANSWSVTTLDDHGSVITTARLANVRKGIYEACVGPGWIALCDADGLDLDDPGREILVLDAHTLRERARVRLKGMPSAIRAWGDRLLVVDGLTGELLLYEGGRGSPSNRLDLGGSSGGTADLAVFAEGAFDDAAAD